MDIMALASVSLSIFLVMNPFSSIPTFLSITNGVDKDTMRGYANRAVVVAGILLFVIFTNLQGFFSVIKSLISVFSPFISGLVFA